MVNDTTASPVADTPTLRHLLEGVASAAHAHASMHEDGGAGLCLPVAAALGYTLTQLAGVRDVSAVCGTVNGEPHWWLEADGVRIDPTRHQFDGRTDLLYPVTENDGYAAEGRFDAGGWSTPALVVAETARAFVYADAADAWASALLGELTDIVQSTVKTSVP